MSLVRLENVSKSYSGQSVLKNASFRVEEGEKIGLIGRNGSGKTTLFRLITGQAAPDTGVVERMRRARIAMLAQLPDVPPETPLMEIVLGRFAKLIELEARMRDIEHRIAAGEHGLLDEYSHVQDQFAVRGGYEFRANAARVLTGLGFAEAEFDLPFRALSGGQRTRLMLALVLIEDADLLLLDEPENHLDLRAREWLETFLQDWPRAFVIISHDRRMLNAVTQRTVEVERGELRSFSGNYDAYQAEKVLIREQQEKAFQRQQDFIRKEESWINRFRYKNTKARQVQSRIKRLEKMERVDAPLDEHAAAKFALGRVVRSGQTVLEARDLAMAYGGLVLYQHVSFDVLRGERLGVIGPNGAGKTTLLRHLAGRLDGGHGRVALGHKVRLAYYDQQHEDLNPANDVLAEVALARPDWKPEQLRSFMGRFLFTGDDIFKPVNALSGGERSRVALAKLVLSGPNLLLLDEPTNHLDIASREALEAALTEFPGAIVVVSHDRVLIDKLVDKLIVLETGRAEIHLGNYSHWRWKQGQVPGPPTPPGDDAMRIRERKQRERDGRKRDDRELRKRRDRLGALEADIEQIEELLEEYEQRFAATDPADYERLRALTREYEDLKRDLAEMYAEWEALADSLAE